MSQYHQNTINTSPESGKLFIVATPIGNLSDMSSRAIEILQNVDLIACEDTRHTKKLCSAFNISTPLTSYYREKEHQKSELLLSKLLDGKQVALVSDAGTPAISDPGAILVQKARNSGVKVAAVAGPSAVTAALSISGIPASNFYFGGFLPSKSSDRRKKISELKSLPCSLIFYEAPHRILKTVSDLITVLGERDAMLFRELTKIHEECIQGRLSEIQEAVRTKIKGELVLIVGGADEPAAQKPEQIEDLILWYKNEIGETLKETVRLISADLDLPRSKVYKLALKIWKSEADTK